MFVLLFKQHPPFKCYLFIGKFKMDFMNGKSKKSRLISGRVIPSSVFIFVNLLFFLFTVHLLKAETQDTVRKSIYPQGLKNKSNVYKLLWGIHYRTLYSTPIVANSVRMDTLLDDIKIIGQVSDFHGLLLGNRQKQLFLLKPLGGSTSFLESKFFQEMYNKHDFKGTYLDEFIGDAYTIINPYTFLSADYMAKVSGLYFNNSRIFYLEKATIDTDTMANGSNIQDKLVSIRDLPDTTVLENILTTEQLLEQIRISKSFRVNQEQYISERLYDMLIGDWNKVPENWSWKVIPKGDSVSFSPIVVDRNHAFTKVDGFLFKRMLKVLGLGFITNYSNHPVDIEKINTLGYTLDMALASESNEAVWLRQARKLQSVLTDSVIDEAFHILPLAIQGSETEAIKVKLKNRRDSLEYMACQYYRKLQRTPVIIGTEKDDRIIVRRLEPDLVRISIYNGNNDIPSYDKLFSARNTKEIWLYGLAGNDCYIVKGKAGKEFPVYLITGKGNNTYEIENGNHIRLYAYETERQKLDALPDVHKIITNEPSVHEYDYEKMRYKEFSFTPWGFYDSDVGFSLGAFFTYSLYGFKQSPFTFRHRIGYNYLRGFMYQGTFPFYNKRKTFNLDVFIGSPKNFSNFFGYGNNTEGFKDEKKNYNRVRIRQYSVRPFFQWEVKKSQQLTFSASFEMYKALHTEGHYINEVYPESHSIFKMNLFTGLEAGYQYRNSLASFMPDFEVDVSAGWKMNIKKTGRNFPYANMRVASKFRCSGRFSIATEMNAKLLFDNKYDFYQAASLNLRGFRNNRFIGKQTFYQLTDFRMDMGKIQNPFTPLKYGLFVGFDYGRVWFPGEYSHQWNTAYGGGFWLTVINKITTKYSWFGSKDSVRFLFELGLGF